ncbi:MAG: hypothetical protein Q4F99_01595 [bacterium]|nr:hypothetical protein [bacterium]
MGLKSYFIVACACIILTVIGCADTTTFNTSYELRCDGAKDDFPSNEKLLSATALYLRNYTSAQIATLPPTNKLTHLCLIDCELLELSPLILSPTLKSLWLSDNHLQSLPKELVNASQLTYLNLDRNRLLNLPDLRQLPLRWLRLNENQLSTWPLIPNSIERLYLAHNRLTFIPSKPTNLKEAELSYNPITQLPDDFGIGMTRLDVAYTQLKVLPKDLSQWQTLRFLNLAGCPMSTEEKNRIQNSFSKSTTIIF